MTIRNLEAMFRPKAVALVGASNQPRALGRVLAENLAHGGFSGPIMPVNPHETAIGALACHRSVEALPSDPDLAVIATPAPAVPQLLQQLPRGTAALR